MWCDTQISMSNMHNEVSDIDSIRMGEVVDKLMVSTVDSGRQRSLSIRQWSTVTRQPSIVVDDLR
jgi:hypothetical protein